MQLGMIGLGEWAQHNPPGGDAGHEGVVYDHNPDAVKSMAHDDNITGVSSLSELAEKSGAKGGLGDGAAAHHHRSDRQAGHHAGGRRHRDRRWQLVLPRRSEARKDTVREWDSPD